MAFCVQLVDAAKACLPEQEPLDRSNYLKGIFRAIDADSSGQIDLLEFKAISAKQSTKSLLVQEEVFKMMVRRRRHCASTACRYTAAFNSFSSHPHTHLTTVCVLCAGLFHSRSSNDPAFI